MANLSTQAPPKTTFTNNEEEDDDQMFGDILEEILSHVPLADLIPALHVSTTWHRAVHCSVKRRRSEPLKPWLILHSQSTRHPYSTTANAYDPRSGAWMKIPQSPRNSKSNPFIKSSHSNFLYTFTPSELSFSFDSLNLTWRHVVHNLTWRVDPIVAKVGDFILLAGGGCDYEYDPIPVEIYDTRTGLWTTSGSTTPPGLIDSAASTWLSIAADDEKERLYVMEKQSGATHCFNLRCDRWSSTRDLRDRLDTRCVYSVVGFSAGRLIVVGLIATVHGGDEKVKIWEVESENFEEVREITEMPSGFLQKLKSGSETFGVSSVNICLGGGFVYIYNPEAVGEVVVCEVVEGGACNWGSVAVAAGGAWIMERFWFTCADVKLEDLQKCRKLNSRRFEYVNV